MNEHSIPPGRHEASWHELTVQKLVRYEAMFQLLDDLHGLDDLAEIGRRTATQWKYFANVASWRFMLPYGDGFLIMDGHRGQASITELDEPAAWDRRLWISRRPHRIKASDQARLEGAPEHLTGGPVSEIVVMPFTRADPLTGADRSIALLSAAARHEPFTELDGKFLQTFGGYLADHVTSILLRKQATELLITRATRDELTGLLNHGAILDELHRAFALSKSGGPPTGVVLADLDYFKGVNDQYGHLTGDKVLRESAHRLQGQTRAGDSIGRFGGEEFLIVLNPSGSGEVVQVGERLRRAIADRPFSAGPDRPQSITITASFGTACTLDEPGLSAEGLLKAADDALYRSKAAGRDRVTASGAAPRTS